ncbi:MAG: cyclic pyranopterin monophosphate synthase MoaC [Bacteroidota bacterium]
MANKLSHLDEKGQAQMVDVGDKQITKRFAHARSTVILPSNILDLLSGDDIVTKKGAVFQTATIAGIMAVKKTSELIPLCHPLPLSKCEIDISIDDNQHVIIDCTTKVSGKTGVEMEALTGASVAALTIYDMCKAMSHDIVIARTELITKTGGKSDYHNSTS